MASDDDISASLAAQGAAKRSRRLPSLLGEDETPVVKEKKFTPPKPLSMLADEAKKFEKGGLGQVGDGSAISFAEWIKKLNRVMPMLGLDLAYKAQIAAAESVAWLLRKHMLEGIDPPLSGMTIGLAKNRIYEKPGAMEDHDARRTDGMALAALARHIKVNRPAKMRKGHRKARDGRPGSPGVFAKGYAPCTISFENEHWDKVAYVLEHGRIWLPPKATKQALMMKAIEGGFVPHEKQAGKDDVWIIPARPFLHVLSGPAAQKIVKDTAQAALMGNLKQEMAKRTSKYVDTMDMMRKEVEDFDQVMSDGSSVEDELLELLDSAPSRNRRRR